MGDVFEEAADIPGEEVAGVALVVKEDEAPGPVGAAFAGPVLAEVGAGHLADKVEEAWGRGSRVRQGRGSHRRTP